MADEVDLVRSRIDLVDLVGQRVALKRAGKSWKGLCPFHDDKRPSFQVNPDLGVYRCWSCGAKGDCFTWVMETERVAFGDALRLLAAQAGVTLSAQAKRDPSERERQERAMASALEFFREQFAGSPTARDYVEGRGIDAATIDQWEIGYAPDVDGALARHLKRAGLPLAECRNLFLVEQDASGGYYDRFRGRLMFPIRDERGNLVAFGGRIIGDGHPKYVNSSDTPLFNKSRVLYGLYRAKEAIASSRGAVLVEGYLDVIACHRAGVTTAVATLGTAMAADHVRLLKRRCDRVTVLYDSDTAGEKAAARAGEMLAEVGLKVTVALMPEGADPDTLLRSAGAEAVRRAAEGGVSPIDFRLSQTRQRLSPDDPAFWREVADALSHAESPLELERLLVPLAAEYPGIRDPQAAQRALRRMVSQVRSQRKRGASDESPDVAAPAPPPVTGPETVLLRALLDDRMRAAAWAAIADDGIFQTEAAAAVARSFRAAFPLAPPEGAPAGWLSNLDETARDCLSDLGLRSTGPLDEETLAGAVARLAKYQAERSLAQERAGLAEDDDRLRAYHAKLKELRTDGK